MNVLLGLLIMIVCLVLQAWLASVAIRYYERREHKVVSGSPWAGMMVITGVMILLVVGNFAQISLWALLFLWLGEFTVYSDSFYHSAVNFATLGYGDVVMSESHRMLGPLEAVNGVLMIGVSTALLMSAFQDAIERRAGRRIQD